MENQVRKRPNPVPFPKTRRPDTRRHMTSARAGKMYPAGFIPMLPQDGIVSGPNGASTFSMVVKMEETEKVLSNAVQVRAHAYFVSLAALDRFNGVEQVGYAWAGVPGSPPLIQNYTVLPKASGGAGQHAFYNAFGEHIADNESVNELYVEAYNQVINHRRKLVSESLPVRGRADHSLARSLWGQTAIARIVPTFDQALIEGEFALSGSLNLPLNANITGYNVDFNAQTAGRTLNSTGGEVGGTTGADARHMLTVTAPTSTNPQPLKANLTAFADELNNTGFSVSLANIDQAKKLKSFAALRSTFSGHPDELVDLLMRGIPMPNTAYRDPVHLGSTSAVIGMQQRYATDAANLDAYVANGVAALSMPIRVPQQPTGGVVVMMYEIVPEPVFDRQADLFLRTNDADDYPNALRDHLDTQQVSVVPNRFVDSLHQTPDGTFGYAPMNYDYIRNRVTVGGRFLRELTSDASAEDQQHIWSVRTVNPVLDEDAFLVPQNLAHNVFLDTASDPFIVQLEYNTTIEGITQFGPALFESSGDYDAVASVAPTDSITPPA